MDKYILEDILTLTKSLAMLYINGTIESSNKPVRKFMETGLEEVLKLQDMIYNVMVSDGFYTVSNVKQTEIDKLYNKLSAY